MSYQEGAFGDFLLVEALYKKAKPEAEAILIVKNEREGKYNILDPSPSSSQAWFVSHTSILNFVDPGLRITWKPEAFLSFASTLSPTSDHRLAEQAFDTLLWGIAQSGISLLPEETIENVFGGVIDQAELNVVDQRQIYADTLASKYGTPVDSLLGMTDPLNKPLLAIQLANEMAQKQTKRFKAAQETNATLQRELLVKERELKRVDRYRKKLAKKKAARKPSKGKKKSSRCRRLATTSRPWCCFQAPLFAVPLIQSAR